MLVCRNSGFVVEDHFRGLTKMIDIGKGGGDRRNVADYRLSRYACYLIVQNGDRNSIL